MTHFLGDPSLYQGAPTSRHIGPTWLYLTGSSISVVGSEKTDPSQFVHIWTSGRSLLCKTVKQIGTKVSTESHFDPMSLCLKLVGAFRVCCCCTWDRAREGQSVHLACRAAQVAWKTWARGAAGETLLPVWADNTNLEVMNDSFDRQEPRTFQGSIYYYIYLSNLYLVFRQQMAPRQLTRR